MVGCKCTPLGYVRLAYKKSEPHHQGFATHLDRVYGFAVHTVLSGLEAYYNDENYPRTTSLLYYLE
jgi:hypothetical protein